MAKHRNDDPEAEPLPVGRDDERPEHPIAGGPRLEVTPLTEGETTRVLLTGDDRTVAHEAYVPTAEYGFRIFVDGQHFEQVGTAADSGTTIFAPRGDDVTFAELQAGVFDDLQYQAQPKPGVQDRVRRYLNEGLERVLRRPRLKNLRLGSMPLKTVAGRGFYGLPMILERIDDIIDTTTGQRLAFRTRDWYRSQDPRPTAMGTPSVWIPEGIVPVMRQPLPGPSDGTTYVYAWSTDAADTTQQIWMRTAYFLGNEVETSAQLNGTTPVLIGYPIGGQIQITGLWLSATTAGYIYINDTTLDPLYWQRVAMIPFNSLSSRHVGVRLYPTPSTELPYEIEGQRVIPKMHHDNDEPPFSADFHEMLQCYARGRMYRKDGRLAQSQMEMAEFERYCIDLTAHVEYPTNYKPVAGTLSAEGSGWSDLGPSYPADRD